MKVLILSCNTGGGHNSAASAICAYFEKMNCECDIVNALDFLPKAKAEFISKGHVLAYKYAPKLYGAGYRMSEMLPQKGLYEQNAKGADELCKKLFSGGYDIVISVHIFAAMMMTELRISREIDIPSFFVATDYTCSPGVSEIDADCYFIPHEKLRDEFVSQGVRADRIVASGIPVREEFLSRTDKAAARRTLGLTEDGRVLLMCCGSMGCGPIRSIAYKIGEVLGENDDLVIICGSNKQLEKDLQFLTGDDIRIKICGFTDKMSLYMDAADLIITKAGGLSTTEAVMKRLPILYIDAVPGVESRNIEFMTGNSYALEAGTSSGMVNLVDTCLSGAVDPMEMVRNREKDFPFNAAKTIYETVCARFERFDRSRSDSKAEPAKVPARSMPEMQKRMMLIVNPVAGKGEMMRNIAEVTGIFMDAGYTVSLFPTKGRSDATEFVKAYAKDFDMVCCSGGDGTMNEVAAGLIEAGLDIPVGYMPSGSTNDFAEFHGISTDVVKAAKRIVSGKEHRVDVGRLGAKYFINAADFGAFTWLPYTTPQRLKNKLGFYAYVLDGIRDLAKLQSEHLRITMNGETKEGEYIFGIVASSSELAGALDFFGQKVVADDGLFEVLLIRLPTSTAELQATINALGSQNLNNELISFCRTDRIEIECMKKLTWALDGEKCVGGSRHTLEMLTRRIRIVY
mgnify:FL=1